MEQENAQEKVNALKALVSLHDLLNQGQFPGHAYQRISDALKFVEALHKQMLNDVKEDEAASILAGLKDKNEDVVEAEVVSE